MSDAGKWDFKCDIERRCAIEEEAKIMADAQIECARLAADAHDNAKPPWTVIYSVWFAMVGFTWVEIIRLFK